MQRPGNYEIELGIPSRDLVYGLAGGPPDGREVKCWFPGGSSAPVLTKEHLDLPYTFEAMAEAGSMLGSGAIIVVDESQPLVPLALRLAEFYRHESCGKCVPCREGTNWTVKMLERIDDGEGTPMDLDILEQVQGNIIGNCLCVLGDSMAMPVASMLKYFRPEFEAHMEAARAPRLAAAAIGPESSARSWSRSRLDGPPRGRAGSRFEIDGKQVRAPEGAMLVDAAKHGDVEIPFFCYEPKLGQPVGACRMCLVEIEGIPKLQTSCSTPVRDGMVVNTTSDRVKHAQNAMVEFLLVNHPLDCPVCDKGGECPLQDISYGWGAGRSRFIEPKRHFKKPLELSPLVAIDRERCILCYRCVRFSQEMAEDYQLVFLERGDHTFVGTHDGRPYVAPFSGNIIELCPVGALTSQAYRFRARPWDIEGSGSVCTMCPAQCNVELTLRDDAKVVRVLARDNEEVDDGWLCDKGRFGYQSFASRRADHRAARARRRLPARPCPGSARCPTRPPRSSARASARGPGGRRHDQRGGLPRPAPAARGARLAARGLRRRRPPLRRPRPHAGPARPVGAGLRHRPRRRHPRARHRAGGRGADPRPARAQGGAPQPRPAGGGERAALHARPERRGGAALRPGRGRGGAGRARRRAGLAARGRCGSTTWPPRRGRAPASARAARTEQRRRAPPTRCARPPTCCATRATWW